MWHVDVRLRRMYDGCTIDHCYSAALHCCTRPSHSFISATLYTLHHVYAILCHLAQCRLPPYFSTQPSAPSSVSSRMRLTSAVLHRCSQPIPSPSSCACTTRCHSSLSAIAAAGADVSNRSSIDKQSHLRSVFPRVAVRPAPSPSLTPLPSQPATFPSYESGLSASRDFTPSINERLSEYSRLPQRGVTLQQLLSVGELPSPLALLASAQFLAQQLPIRLAKRVMELDSLPYGLSNTSAVQTVKGWYKLSFKSTHHAQSVCTVGANKSHLPHRSLTPSLCLLVGNGLPVEIC